MIAVDTNVLVRLIVADGPKQAALARDLIEAATAEGRTCYLSTPVICELEWVLVSRYRVPRTEIAAVLKRLLDNTVFAFEDRDVLLQALAAYRQRESARVRGPSDRRQGAGFRGHDDLHL
jgi:predicted nucleic-acid-binding protein